MVLSASGLNCCLTVDSKIMLSSDIQAVVLLNIQAVLMSDTPVVMMSDSQVGLSESREGVAKHTCILVLQSCRTFSLRCCWRSCLL